MPTSVDGYSAVPSGGRQSSAASLTRRLNTPVHRLLFGTFYRGDRLRQAVEDHERILAAALACDAEVAAAAMRKHPERPPLLQDLDRAKHLKG